MNDVDPLLTITNIIQDVGIWAIFAWLFMNERKDHNKTRNRHMDDLRDVAGMKQHLSLQDSDD